MGGGERNHRTMSGTEPVFCSKQGTMINLLAASLTGNDFCAKTKHQIGYLGLWGLNSSLPHLEEIIFFNK